MTRNLVFWAVPIGLLVCIASRDWVLMLYILLGMGIGSWVYEHWMEKHE